MLARFDVLRAADSIATDSVAQSRSRPKIPRETRIYDNIQDTTLIYHNMGTLRKVTLIAGNPHYAHYLWQANMPLQLNVSCTEYSDYAGNLSIDCWRVHVGRGFRA